MNIQGIINSFFLLLPITLAITSDFVFEFGIDQGDVIYHTDGTIYFLNPLTSVEIPVPDGVTVTYVKVTVNALSPPKVDYDNLYRKVIIKYSWTQISQSTYNVLVKGMKVNNG
ncbi:unnamed protein product [Parnassius mnemosyne]|uniref:Uncharacterized protein n=1 Tax=Parnassius mnemosyne TaxID=213953 RepID=A0AAV1KP30_9NEOP